MAGLPGQVDLAGQGAFFLPLPIRGPVTVAWPSGGQPAAFKYMTRESVKSIPCKSLELQPARSLPKKKLKRLGRDVRWAADPTPYTQVGCSGDAHTLPSLRREQGGTILP